MKRLCVLAALTLLSPSAHAGSSFSFSVVGHRVHIESSRHCRSTSCASMSISGISRSVRDSADGNVTSTTKAPATATAAPPVASASSVQPVAAPPPAVFKPAAVATHTVAAPPPPRVQPVAVAPPHAPPPAPSVEAVRPAPVAAPPISRVSHDVEDDVADTPIGDWQTEGKGMVRIAKCGSALCGYVLESSSDDRGEAVLVNMKSGSDRKWTGKVVSHDSGDTYYGTMELKRSNTLRVEACALLHFYCSGNNWTRINIKPARLMSSRQTLAEPRS